MLCCAWNAVLVSKIYQESSYEEICGVVAMSATLEKQTVRRKQDTVEPNISETRHAYLA